MLSGVSTSPRGLSRRLTQYGDEGFARFLRETFLESAGLSKDAMDRPVIGIASTASDFNPCHATAPELRDVGGGHLAACLRAPVEESVGAEAVA